MDENIINLLNDTIFNYRVDFWELIDKFGVYENVSGSKLSELFISSKVQLYEFLKFKKITEYYGYEIKEYMIGECGSAEILLDKYEMKHFRPTEEVYLPKELSNKDKENIISNYIESEKANPNYLQLI